MLKTNSRVSRIGGLILILLGAFAWGSAASAQTLTTLTSFSVGNGAYPTDYGSLIADANGNLFGTTLGGGGSGYGTVFEIVKSGGVYAGTPTTLVSFNFSNGAYPYAGLMADANGSLFGTTYGGGTSGDGTVFEIVNTGGLYTLTTLVSFNSSDGANPRAGLIADANGDLFGTTESGGSGNGTVFEIVKTSGAYSSTPATLVSFNGNDGAFPFGGLIADANGNLLGTTEAGGGSGDGTVFEIVNTGGLYTLTTLVNFNSSDGANPLAGLIADANGNLFGTTSAGGSGYGTVFEIVKTSGGYASTPTTLASFDSVDGANPLAGLIADANGNLFGTTDLGGATGYGTVFEIVKTSGGYASTPSTLVSFNLTDGAVPLGGLIADANGNLFGTTELGGGSGYGYGTVFEVTGSGFVPPKKFAGAPGSANCTGASISILAQAYGGVAHAAPALGYASVSALQTAVASYCGK